MVSLKELMEDFEEFRKVSPASIAMAVLIIVSVFYVIQSLL